MYLKKLEMFGFKSFADRTDFHFRPGMSGIVGPNGCGKSNVVDGFKWILGAQSAKGLRGSEMKDVIFNGTQNRKPSGYAEVSVVFDNEDGFLDIDYAEVCITRRLFRSGESEYLINKQKCRLKDVKELFLDTGIGQSSYSILEQGKIDVLLQSSPQDRRLIFEEAAGISKYRVKKAETLRALLRVEDNLSRLQDIIDEVDRRIRRVKAQAAKAQRYKQISDRLKELRIRTALEDYNKSVVSRTDLSFGLYWAKHRLDQLEDLERRLSAGLDVQLETRHSLLERLRVQRGAIAEEATARELVEERIEHSRRRLQELAEEQVRKKDDLDQTIESFERLRSELQSEEESRSKLVIAIEEKREMLGELEAEFEDRQESFRALQENLRDLKNQIVEVIQRRSRVANLSVQVSSELNSLEARRERLENALRGYSLELEESRNKAANFEAKTRELDERRALLESERDELSSRVEDLEAVIAREEEVFAGRKETLHRLSSRFEVLNSFEERLDGVASGVAEVLKLRDQLPATARSCALVGSLLKVERRYAMSLEAALGDLTQTLAVDSQEGALDLLHFVKDRALGGVRVIALDRVDHIEAEFFPKCGGVLGPLREYVEVEEEYEELFDRLLVNVVLVEDLKTAVALSRNGLRPFRLVTLEGEVIEPWGALAVAGEAEMGIISRRSEMDELQVEVSALETETSELHARITEKRVALTECRAQLQAKAEALEAAKRQAVSLQHDASQAERETQRLDREIGVCSSELEEVCAESEKHREEKSEHEARALEIDREQAELESAAEKLDAGIEDGQRQVAVASEARAQSRLMLAQSEKHEEGLGELIKQRTRNLEEREKRGDDLRREIATLVRRSGEVEEVISKSLGELEEVRQRESELREQLSMLEQQDAGLQDVEKAFRRETEHVRADAASVRREKEDYQLREQEDRHRRNTILERIDEQYGLDLREMIEDEQRRVRDEEQKKEEKARSLQAELETGEQVESEESAETDTETPAERSSAEATSSSSEVLVPPSVPPEAATSGDATGESGEDAETPADQAVTGDARFFVELPDWDRNAAYEEIKALQEKLRRLGSVNLESLDEIEELENRFEFQRAQKEDLIEGEKHLRAIIDDINRKSREMFSETFEKVREQFSELFRKSFGGGRAELVLEDSADILEAGIEIVARPPGKKLTSLSLMSGGEKTMTTLALVLAIFRSRPSPFCILDEVDAPLDDANVLRFIVLLKEFIDQSQFIIITHNKLTMAEASTLYGVTMQERGVSKRVAVELESYDPEEMELAASTGAAE